MTAKKKKKTGRPAHVPSPPLRVLVLALTAVGYCHAVIAAHMNIAIGTLRLHYRRELDHAVEQICANAFARMIAASQKSYGMAGVKASMWILAVRAGLVEPQKLEVQDTGRGITAILKIIEEAKNEPDYNPDDFALAEGEPFEIHNPAPRARH